MTEWFIDDFALQATLPDDNIDWWVPPHHLDSALRAGRHDWKGLPVLLISDLPWPKTHVVWRVIGKEPLFDVTFQPDSIATTPEELQALFGSQITVAKHQPGRSFLLKHGPSGLWKYHAAAGAFGQLGATFQDPDSLEQHQGMIDEVAASVRRRILDALDPIEWRTEHLEAQSLAVELPQQWARTPRGDAGQLVMAVRTWIDRMLPLSLTVATAGSWLLSKTRDRVGAEWDAASLNRILEQHDQTLSNATDSATRLMRMEFGLKRDGPVAVRLLRHTQGMPQTRPGATIMRLLVAIGHGTELVLLMAHAPETVWKVRKDVVRAVLERLHFTS